MEAKIFKKKYERIAKHMSGMPKDVSFNPFESSYKPSVFNEDIVDPKMNIPQNKELFENVIKSSKDQHVNATEGAADDYEPPSKLKKGAPEDEEMENEIMAIRAKLRKKITSVKDVNLLEFLEFMMANYDYKHDYWKLNKDLTLRLKQEESRAAFY